MDEHPSPSEREALRALRRERKPKAALEERTVKALRRRGLLRSGGGTIRFPWSARIGLAAAAAAAIFLAGVLVGERRVQASGLPVEPAGALEEAPARPVEVVESAGSAYVSAIGALAEYSESTEAEEIAYGQRVAVDVLRAAASELSHLAPDDPFVSDVVQSLRFLEAGGEPDPEADLDEPRNIIWF